MDQRTRKFVTMHKVSHPREEKGRGLASLGDCTDASIRRLEDCIKKNKEKLITAICNSTDTIRIKRTTTKTRKKNWEQKQLLGYFRQQTAEIPYEMTRTGLRNGNHRK